MVFLRFVSIFLVVPYRQPNWANVITSKDQEKDLKAFTCKTCGSTIFIAKTREFFFEGSTGIGGLGCFSCGAKGPDNFVMDRDRIVEDVADVDDYFDYERPLDFISRAERRALMKEAGGDEEKANQILIDRSNAPASVESQDQAEAIVNGGKVEPATAAGVAAEEDQEGVEEGASLETTEEDEETSADTVESSEVFPVGESKIEEKADADSEATVSSPSESRLEPPQKETVKSAKSLAKKTPPPPPSSDDDLDLLGMDDF